MNNYIKVKVNKYIKVKVNNLRSEGSIYSVIRGIQNGFLAPRRDVLLPA